MVLPGQVEGGSVVEPGKPMRYLRRAGNVQAIARIVKAIFFCRKVTHAHGTSDSPSTPTGPVLFVVAELADAQLPYSLVGHVITATLTP